MTRLPLRLAGRLLRLLIASFFIGTVASAIAATVARSRLVSIGGPEDDHVELVRVFGSLDFRSAARSFRGGSMLAWFAGAQLDLRNASLDAAGAELEVRTIFAGTNVVVPAGWRVSVTGPAIFGANSASAGPEPEPGAPELRVHALTVFGGTSISAEAWDLAASEQTMIIAPDGATVTGEPTAPEGVHGAAADQAPSAGPEDAVPAEPGDAAPAAEPAPKRRRRRAAQAEPAATAEAASEPAPGTDRSVADEPA
jgi:hypothetical protein